MLPALGSARWKVDSTVHTASKARDLPIFVGGHSPLSPHHSSKSPSRKMDVGTFMQNVGFSPSSASKITIDAMLTPLSACSSSMRISSLVSGIGKSLFAHTVAQDYFQNDQRFLSRSLCVCLLCAHSVAGRFSRRTITSSTMFSSSRSDQLLHHSHPTHHPLSTTPQPV